MKAAPPETWPPRGRLSRGRKLEARLRNRQCDGLFLTRGPVRPRLQQRAQGRATSTLLGCVSVDVDKPSGVSGAAGAHRAAGFRCWKAKHIPAPTPGMTVRGHPGPFPSPRNKTEAPGGTHFGDTRPCHSGLGTGSSRVPSSGSNLPMCSGLASALKTHEGLLPGRILGCRRRALSCFAHLPPCAAHRWGSATHVHPWLPL